MTEQQPSGEVEEEWGNAQWGNDVPLEEETFHQTQREEEEDPRGKSQQAHNEGENPGESGKVEENETPVNVEVVGKNVVTEISDVPHSEQQDNINSGGHSERVVDASEPSYSGSEGRGSGQGRGRGRGRGRDSSSATDSSSASTSAEGSHRRKRNNEEDLSERKKAKSVLTDFLSLLDKKKEGDDE